ncbi:MAG: putative bifunctional diguanylate cyclase/phosphodiesterase [Acidimicrobiia bacterium]
MKPRRNAGDDAAQERAKSALVREAQVAGLRSFGELPTLEDVERRRLHLWLVSTIMLVAASALVAILSLFPEDSLSIVGPAQLRGSFVALSILFSAYAVEKEFQLRRLTRMLVEERVTTTSLTSRLREITALLDARKAVNSVLDLEKVLDVILNSALDLPGGEAASIMLLQGDELQTICVAGNDAALGSRVKVGEGIAGRVAETGEPLLISGKVDRAAFKNLLTRETHVQSAVSVPMLDRGQVIGVLNVSTTEGRDFTEYDLRAVSVFAEDAATAISKARLYEAARSEADHYGHLALHDPLTNLANRAYLADQTNQAIARAERRGGAVALLFADLDNFKVVNDTLGHGTGDELLVMVAERIGSCLRKSDTGARFGGDEFAILVDDADDAQSAILVADRLLEAMRKPFRVGVRDLVVEASIGIAWSGQHGSSFEELLRHADMAMYEAKRLGRARFSVFETPMETAAAQRKALERDLAGVVERGELVVNYQPAIELESGRTVGAEALLRWLHPQRGTLLPDDFVGIASACGLMADIGRWVLDTACADLRRWRDEFGDAAPSWVSVKVSAEEIEGLAEAVGSALGSYGLDGASLMVEVSEATLEVSPGAKDVLSNVRAMGARVAVDNFGRGPSSLSSLFALPVDVLKVDRSLVAALPDVASGYDVVGALVDISRRLELLTVGEGVEHPLELESLLERGFDAAQGFLCGEPVAAGAFAEKLSSGLATGGS